MSSADGGRLLTTFWAQLATAQRALLLLDYDGTLAPFTLDPADAHPYPGITGALERLLALPTSSHRLVIVSGRWLRDLRPLLGIDHGLEMWGCHGRERRLPDGRHSLTPLPEAAVRALAEADAWETMARRLGGRVERKPASLAFHWRGLPAHRHEALRQALAQRFAELPENNTLAWHDFDGGVELRVPGRDKGDVVRTLLAETPPGAPTPRIAYLGDDLTDEDAFKALGEQGLSVLVRPEYRPTAAQLWLRPPEDLLAFLHRWADIREQTG
ncbi:trehalose-phosphatase [Immundisolibacter sp.]|uniref:trehalose-phosphatase n=1 Tax=Immundisolibacter sp. TaxID=1934948 RepID=UPI003564E46E